jgi:hypothetical protein
MMVAAGHSGTVEFVIRLLFHPQQNLQIFARQSSSVWRKSCNNVMPNANTSLSLVNIMLASPGLPTECNGGECDGVDEDECEHGRECERDGEALPPKVPPRTYNPRNSTWRFLVAFHKYVAATQIWMHNIQLVAVMQSPGDATRYMVFLGHACQGQRVDALHVIASA